MSDIYVYVVDMPARVREAVAQDDDGSYTIWINSLLSNEERGYAYEHAMLHIQRNDFQGGDVQRIEEECHATIQERRRTKKVG